MTTQGQVIWSIDFSRTADMPPVRKETIKGVEFNVGLSPFGVPMEVRVTFDPNSCRLVIVFDYPNREPEMSVCDHEDPQSVIYVGERSARVQRIEVTVEDDAGQPVVDRVRLNLRAAAHHVEAERKRAPSSIRDNYTAVASSLRSDALLEHLASSS